MNNVKPIYLLPDSQLLFIKNKFNQYYLSSVADLYNNCKAAYIGASNQDNPAFYEIFVAAMSNLGIKDCSMIHSSFTSEDITKLKEADLILLAGGDVRKGLEVIENSGMKDIIVDRYHNGATLIGTSAGAIQLGWEYLITDGLQEEIIKTLRIVPFSVDTSHQVSDWENLKKLIVISESMKRAFGIPAGSGIIYHPDQTVEVLNKNVDEFVWQNEELKESLLFCKDIETL